MQIGQSRRAVAAVAVCLVIVATGCGGSSKPKHSFTPTSTFSDPRGTGAPAPSTPAVATTGPNVRPGEKPPVLLAAAKANSPLGATEFAKFWIETLDWGYATTDSTLAREYFAPSCTDCTLFMRNFDGPHARGQHFRGGRLHLDSWLIAENDGRNGATQAVDVTFSAQALQTVDAAGEIVQKEASVAKMTYRLWLKRAGDSWIVVQKGTVE